MLVHSLKLPDDPSLEQLDPSVRAQIARHWADRAASEASVAVSFEALRPRLRAVGAEAPVLTLLDKAIDDERRHAALCNDLARRYAGEVVSASPPKSGALPDFETGDEPMEVSLLILGMCCINESIATHWIRACWKIATSPTAIFANREHLKDEIDHARLGWAHMASSRVSESLRARLRPWVPRLVAVNAAAWKEAHTLPEDGIPAHGHLARVAHHRAIDEAVEGLVWPGLAEVRLA